MPIEPAPQVTNPQPGDLGFAHISGDVGWWVDLAQALLGDAAPFDHVYAVVAAVGDVDYPEGLIVEAMPHGARSAKLSDRLGPGFAYARVPLTSAQKAMCPAVGRSFTEVRGGRGVPYSFGSYLALALIHWGFTPKWLLAMIAARKSLICSQLVDEFLRRLGYQLFNDGGWIGDISPGDVFARTDPRIVPLTDSVGVTRRTAPKEGSVMRKPAEWSLAVGALTAILDWLVGFGWSSLTADQAALIVAAITAVAGVVVAIKTRPIAPGAFTYLISAGAALLGGYGLHFSQQGVATFSAAFVAVLAFIMRGHVAPVADVRAGVVARDGVTVLKS